MKKIKLLLIILITSSLTSSCLVDDEQSQQEVNQANTPIVVGFTESVVTISHFSDIGTIENIIRMSFLGGGKGFAETDLNIPFTIDPASTAQQGVEFNLNTSSITLPAQRDFGELILNVNTGNFNPDLPTELILNLAPEDIAETTDAQQSIKLIFIGCQSGIAGTYTNPDLPSGAGGVTNFTETAPNNFIFTMPFLGTGGGVNPISMTLVDICGDITLTGWQFDTALSGNVSLNNTTGEITIDNLIIYNGATVDPDDVWFDLGSSTYTPQ
jgi:hypothetical protein